MASEITQVGAYHLADNPDSYEIQRNNNFVFVVTGIDNIVNVGSSDNQVIPNAEQVLKFSVVSAPVPTFSQNPIEIRRGNSVMKAAGLPSFRDGQVVVRDFIGEDSKSALMSWQNLSYNVKTERVGKMRDYKKTCYLQEYDVNFSRIVRTWRMMGCWVSGLEQDNFDVTSGDEKRITATISFDKAFMELPDEI